MGSMFDDTDDKVLFKNIEPTRKKISAFQIPKKLVPRAASHNEDKIDLDDDFQDLDEINDFDSSASPAN
ncbi:hypothetical protein P3S67_023291 [Capsicum chacoense]